MQPVFIREFEMAHSISTSYLAALGLTLCAAVLSGCQDANEHPGLLETKAIAEEGLIYGLPIVMNYTVMYSFAVDKDSSQFKAPFNTLKSSNKVLTYQDTTVVTPNSDTPYSVAWLDLRREPMVISVPAVVPSRYYSVQLIDGNTFNYGYIGSRATGSEAGDYMVVGPDWQGATPDNIKQVFRSGSQFSMALFRTQLFSAEDMANVEQVQAGYRVQPLSGFLQQPAPPAIATLSFPEVDAELAKKNFFTYLDFALQFAPAGPEEKAIRARLARIGVGPEKTFDFADLPWLHKLAALWGMKAGSDKIEASLGDLGSNINGWRISDPAGDRAFYKGNWLKRAAVAKAGIYANDGIEAMYPMARTLSDGQPLDGSKHNYKLTFPAGQLPPVHAFWSLTMYDGNSQFLIKNPLDRYLINSPMLPYLKKNPDGSLTLYLQKDAPNAEQQANWLPAPDGPIYLVMRLYWPTTEAPSIFPAGHGSWQPPAIELND